MSNSDFIIEEHPDYLLVKCLESTPLTVELAAEMVCEEVKIDQGRKLNDIWDLCNAEPSEDMNYEGVNKLIGHILFERSGRWHSKTAILVGADFRYGVARMYKSLAIDLPFEVEIFDDKEQAVQWLLGKSPC